MAKVALVQMGSVPGSFNATVDRMLQMAERARRLGAELALFPATVLGGAYPLGLCEQRSYQLDLLDAVASFAERTPVAAVVPVCVLEDAEGDYTELFYCEDGRACPLRRREKNLPGSSSATVADAPAKFTVGGVQVRLSAGDAVDPFSEDPCEAVASFVPMPFCHADISTLGIYGVASETLSPLIQRLPGWFMLVQGVGGYDDVVLAGGSYALDPRGVVVAACSLFEEDVAVFELGDCPTGSGGGRVGDETGSCGCAADARTDPDGDDEQPRPLHPGCFVGMAAQDIPAPSQDFRCGALYRALVVSVRDYVRKSGFADVIVGLSGGVDSSLVASVAADALGPEHVLGVLMPGPFSSAASVDDARALAGNLGMPSCTVPIGGVFDAFVPLLRDALGGPFEGLARENLQARLRGTVLMSLANARGALVLNTGNKTESALGYSTLYGDTVGAYSPLADVYKGLVYSLARWRNSRGPLPVIPQNVLDKPPSAELSAEQTDEGSLGARYADIDLILDAHIEHGRDAQAIVEATGFDPELVNRILSLCATAEYKRRQEPLGPAVSLRPLADRGWPVVLGWRDRAVAPDAPDASCSEGACSQCCVLDAADTDALDCPSVDAVLDEMLGQAAHRDQVVSTIGDVVFGALVSGRGPDMDDCLGMPLFSKN